MTEDNMFLFAALFTDGLFYIFLVCGFMVLPMYWYLNHGSYAYLKKETPFLSIDNVLVGMVTVGFVSIGLFVSLPGIHVGYYEAIPAMQCSSKNYDSSEIVKYFQNRKDKVVRLVEFRNLETEYYNCQVENKIETDIATKQNETPTDASAM